MDRSFSQSQNTYSIILRRCVSVVQLHLNATSNHLKLSTPSTLYFDHSVLVEDKAYRGRIGYTYDYS
jgi:hypothetical protein